MIWYFYQTSSLRNFPEFVVIHTVKGFSIVSEAEAVFWFCFFLISLLFYDPADVGNLISDSPAFSKFTLYI